MSPKQTRKKTRELIGVSAEENDISCPALRVVIIPEALLKEDTGNGHGDSPCPAASTIVKIRGPKHGNPELFLIDDVRGTIYQMNCFREPPRSWFINDTVCRDGSIVLTTEVDPLFLILPYLKKRDMFRPLDQIIVDSDFPECVKLLSCKDLQRRVMLIADVKELKDMRTYRFSMEKCTKWLRHKVSRVQKVLREREVHVTSGAQAATFVRNKKEKVASEEDYQRYAHGIISEFLPKDISDVLLEQLGISASPQVEEPSEDLSEPPSKRAKTSNKDTGPTEDYSVGGVSSLGQTEKKKLTTAQKALNKVDKTGMKNIASFFGKKTTK